MISELLNIFVEDTGKRNGLNVNNVISCFWFFFKHPKCDESVEKSHLNNTSWAFQIVWKKNMMSYLHQRSKFTTKRGWAFYYYTNSIFLCYQFPVTSYRLPVTNFQLPVTVTVVIITILVIPTNNFLLGKKIIKNVEKSSGKKKWEKKKDKKVGKKGGVKKKVGVKKNVIKKFKKSGG